MSAADAWLIAEWQAAMRVDGWTRSAAERGAKTLRRLARVSGGGLLGCTQFDVLHFAADKARGLPAEDLMASASWHRALRTLDAFYGWAAGRFLLPVGSPLAGLRRVPRAGARAEAKTTGAWRRYDQVLNEAGANPRARAVLAVLALGLTVGEVMRLRSDDVDLERGELRVGGRGARRGSFRSARERLNASHAG